MTEAFVVPTYPKSKSVIKFIDNALADNFIFAGLNKDERLQLINAMTTDSVIEGTVIIQQGDIGDYFYVVENGTISFAVDGNHVGSCSRGATFGELALLYDCPRAATCIAQSDCNIWKVDQKTFRHMLANNYASQQKDVLDVLKKVKFLADLDDPTLIKIADALATIKFDEGDKIINKGDAGEVFYILKEGRVKVHDIGFGDSQYVDQILGPGDFFGERALLTGEPRAADITAEVASVCLCLSREDFEKSLGPLQDLIDHAMKKRVLMGVY
jgi:cAMP-dependent protein kinase regulator